MSAQRGDGDRAVRADLRVDLDARHLPLRRAGRHRQPVRSQLATTTATPPRSGSPNVNDGGTLVGGTLTNAYPLVRGMYNKREDKHRRPRLEQRVQGRRRQPTADLSWSKAHRDELSLENNLQLLPTPQFDTLNLASPTSASPRSSRAATTPTRPRCSSPNTIYGSGYGKTPKVVDELKGFRVNANFAAPFDSTACSPTSTSARTTPPREDQAPARRQHQPRRAGPDDHRRRPAVRPVPTSPAWASPASWDDRLRAPAPSRRT